MKTNKSLTKRLKITRNGKILARRGGKNHFNAKESRSKQLANKKNRDITQNFNTKALARFLANQF
jgi:ribosomal protein L35